MNTLSSWKAIQGHRWFIILVTIIVAIAAYVGTSVQPITYDASISLRVNRINKVDTQYYDDSYFGIQASDLFSQTVISWFLTPSVLLDIYNQAGIDPHISSLDRFAKRFSVKKFSPQNIVVRFTERDEETAKKIADGVTVVVRQKSSEINTTAEQKALFEVVGETPVIVETERQVGFMTIVGAIVGLIGSVILVFTKEYLTEE